MILYFLRHGLAGSRDEWKGDDSRRPLTKKGIKNMVAQAKTLARLDLHLELILTSPLTRAFQTADIVSGELKMVDKLEQDERLGPGFGYEELVQLLAGRPELKTVMLVGHEPSFSQTISALTGGGGMVLKKGGLARVDITSIDPFHGDLVWLLPPRIMLH